MRLVFLLLLIAGGLGGAAAGGAADTVTVVEDWSKTSPGATGVPAGWREYETPGGRARYDFAVVSEDGVRALRLKSRDEHSTIAKEVQVDLRATPILEWTWKAVKLPEAPTSAAARHRISRRTCWSPGRGRPRSCARV